MGNFISINSDIGDKEVQEPLHCDDVFYDPLPEDDWASVIVGVRPKSCSPHGGDPVSAPPCGGDPVLASPIGGDPVSAPFRGGNPILASPHRGDLALASPHGDDPVLASPCEDDPTSSSPRGGDHVLTLPGRVDPILTPFREGDTKLGQPCGDNPTLAPSRKQDPILASAHGGDAKQAQPQQGLVLAPLPGDPVSPHESDPMLHLPHNVLACPSRDDPRVIQPYECHQVLGLLGEDEPQIAWRGHSYDMIKPADVSIAVDWEWEEDMSDPFEKALARRGQHTASHTAAEGTTEDEQTLAMQQATKELQICGDLHHSMAPKYHPDDVDMDKEHTRTLYYYHDSVDCMAVQQHLDEDGRTLQHNRDEDKYCRTLQHHPDDENKDDSTLQNYPDENKHVRTLQHYPDESKDRDGRILQHYPDEKKVVRIWQHYSDEDKDKIDKTLQHYLDKDENNDGRTLQHCPDEDKNDRTLQHCPDEDKDDRTLQHCPDEDKNDKTLQHCPDEDKDDRTLQHCPDEDEDKGDKILQHYPDEDDKDDKILQHYPDEKEEQDDKILHYPDEDEDKDDKILQHYPDEDEDKDDKILHHSDEEDDKILQHYPNGDEGTTMQCYPDEDDDQTMKHYPDEDKTMHHYPDSDEDQAMQHYPDSDEDKAMQHYPDSDEDKAMQHYPDEDEDKDRKILQHYPEEDEDRDSRTLQHYPDEDEDGRTLQHHFDVNKEQDTRTLQSYSNEDADQEDKTQQHHTDEGRESRTQPRGQNKQYPQGRGRGRGCVRGMQHQTLPCEGQRYSWRHHKQKNVQSEQGLAWRSHRTHPYPSRHCWGQRQQQHNNSGYFYRRRLGSSASDDMYTDSEEGERSILEPEHLVEVLAERPSFRATLTNLFDYQRFAPGSVRQVAATHPHVFHLNSDGVQLRPQIKLCQAYLSAVGCSNSLCCGDLHACNTYVSSWCTVRPCPLGHSLYTEHNKTVLEKFHLAFLQPQHLKKLLRNLTTAPSLGCLDVCREYNRGQCDKADCQALHLCLSFVVGRAKCSRPNCALGHNPYNLDCTTLLIAHGISVNETIMDIIVALLNANPTLTTADPTIFSPSSPPPNTRFITSNINAKEPKTFFDKVKQKFRLSGSSSSSKTLLQSDSFGSREIAAQKSMENDFQELMAEGQQGLVRDGSDESLLSPQVSSSTSSMGPSRRAKGGHQAVWAYHRRGTVSINEICRFSVEGTCMREDTCPRLHTSRPFHWQVCNSERQNSWLNLPGTLVTYIEEAYCDPAKNGISLPPLDPAHLHRLGEVLDQNTWYANFEAMVLINSDCSKVVMLRRLCAEAGIRTPYAKARTFIWYFCDINGRWIKYGEADTSGKTSHASSITSVNIEAHYQARPDVPLSFKISQFTYLINFGTMMQTNQITKVQRPVRRRPESHLTSSTQQAPTGTRAKKRN